MRRVPRLKRQEPVFRSTWGGGPITDISASMKTIANFWPYATTLFDFIRRAMPWQQPRSLSDAEVYALTAFILSKNNLIGETDTMNAETLSKVRMPNRDNFIIRFPTGSEPVGHFAACGVQRNCHVGEPWKVRWALIVGSRLHNSWNA
jgi:cytochrome c